MPEAAAFSEQELEEVRALFEMPPEEVYLACASRAPLARRTFEVGVRAAAQKKLPWSMSSDGVEDRVRAAFARLVNCDPVDVALCPSTSFSLTTAARAIGTRVRSGDVGLILEDQMSSNVYPWQMLQHERGLHLEAVPYPADGDWTRALVRRLEELEVQGRRVAVVAVPVFLWTDGSGPLDLLTVLELCRRPGRCARTALVVDGTQSLGAVPFDVQRTPVDFLAASVHKWLFGAYGLSCIYVAPEWSADALVQPLVEDEHSRAHMVTADDEAPFDLALPGYPLAYQPGARRFDGGGRPNPILLPMAEDGLKLVLQWGPARVAATLEPLTRRIREHCVKELGLWAPPFHGPHFLGVAPGQRDACRTPAAVSAWVREAAAFLKAQHFHTTARLKVLRVAPHLYTRPADVESFLDALGAFVQLRRSRPQVEPEGAQRARL